jgi:hypothetical protein
VVGELALVTEAGVLGDLCQGQVHSRLKQLLGPLDARRTSQTHHLGALGKPAGGRSLATEARNGPGLLPV